MLHAEVLVSHAIIEREFRREPPAILRIQRPILIPVAAVEQWVGQRIGQRARGRNDGIPPGSEACIRSRSTRERPRGVERLLELVHRARDEVIEPVFCVASS